MIEGSPLGIMAGAWWARTAATLEAVRYGRETQREVAKALGTGQGIFWAYEHGTTVPRMAKATAWAVAMRHQLAVSRGHGPGREVHPFSRWDREVGQAMGRLREAAGWSQRGMRDETVLPLTTVQAVEHARDVVATTWAAYVFAIGWAPVLLDAQGRPACHTRGPGAVAAGQ